MKKLVILCFHFSKQNTVKVTEKIKPIYNGQPSDYTKNYKGII